MTRAHRTQREHLQGKPLVEIRYRFSSAPHQNRLISLLSLSRAWDLPSCQRESMGMGSDSAWPWRCGASWTRAPYCRGGDGSYRLRFGALQHRSVDLKRQPSRFYPSHVAQRKEPCQGASLAPAQCHCSTIPSCALARPRVCVCVSMRVKMHPPTHCATQGFLWHVQTNPWLFKNSHHG